MSHDGGREHAEHEAQQDLEQEQKYVRGIAQEIWQDLCENELHDLLLSGFHENGSYSAEEAHEAEQAFDRAVEQRIAAILRDKLRSRLYPA